MAGDQAQGEGNYYGGSCAMKRLLEDSHVVGSAELRF